MKDKEIRQIILEELTTGLPSDLVIMDKIAQSKLAERISQLLKEREEKIIEECVNKLDLYLRFEKTELDVTNSGRYFEASQLNENLKNLLTKPQ
jgi:hypothetical protein